MIGVNSYLDTVQTKLVFGMGLPILGVIITRPLVLIWNPVIFGKKCYNHLAKNSYPKTFFAWSECTKAETCRCARQLDFKCSAGIQKPAYWGQQASKLAISSDWNILKLARLSTWLAGSTDMTACCFSGDITRAIQLDPSWQNWSKGEVLHKCIYYLWSQRSSSESQFSLIGLHKYNRLQKWL